MGLITMTNNNDVMMRKLLKAAATNSDSPLSSTSESAASAPESSSLSPPPPQTPSPPPPSLSPLQSSSSLAPPPPPPPSSSSSSTSSTNLTAVLAGVVAGLALLILLFVVMLLVACCRRKKKKHNPQSYSQGYYRKHANKKARYTISADHHMDNTSSGQATVGSWAAPPMTSSPVGLTKNMFTYEELAEATKGFSQGNVLGQGGFGFVHKGVLPGGKEIAVKSLKTESDQGEREFQAEVDIISRVHHRHLVSLVGYCMAGEQRMLVYEFVPNNTLEFHLHGKDWPPMDFPSRLKIALGSAKGLAYLHEDCSGIAMAGHPRIFHRDIKAANILLEHDFEAKVADFGLAKFSNDNNTHVSTRVMGTFGYLAPEYAASGKLTEKSDVFSFGVVLLELITGRRPINPTGDEGSLVDWARPQLGRMVDEGVFEGIVDPQLESNFNPQEMTRLAACAAASIRHSAKRRPKMSQIVRALEGDMSLEALNEGVKPGQSMYLGGETSSSYKYNASLYRRDLHYFKRALESEDNMSSECEPNSITICS